MAKKPDRYWADMLAEPNAHERMARENLQAVLLLNYFASKVKPYEGWGWTVFNDWLDYCYFRKKNLMRDRPPELPYIPVEWLRELAFPACRM